MLKHLKPALAIAIYVAGITFLLYHYHTFVMVGP